MKNRIGKTSWNRNQILCNVAGEKNKNKRKHEK
jgi:hypothetical protein